MVDPCPEFAHGLGAVGNIEFFENTLHVVFDGERADLEDAADFGVGFAQGDPFQDFGFALGEDIGLG